jgi:23S rRNA (cytosine1962-C5)-methyltransferase
VDRLGDFLLSQSDQPLAADQAAELRRLMEFYGSCGAYHKLLTRQVRRSTAAEVSPQPTAGSEAPERFSARENGVRFEMSFSEGYSAGLFLDQRENRRRLLTGHVAADFPPLRPAAGGWEMLNVFSYTCGFSVCAAMAGARTTSLDLSRKYNEWGKRNFIGNGLAPEDHEFIQGDAFEWLRRLARKGRRFDVIALDPPTFSQSKEHGVFRAEKDFGELARAALPTLKTGGVLFASTNAERLEPEQFLAMIAAEVRSAGREVVKQHYAPQPADFPVHRDTPAHLKTVWLALS